MPMSAGIPVRAAVASVLAAVVLASMPDAGVRASMQEDVALAPILARAAAAVEADTQALAGLVMQEDYQQIVRDRPAVTRRTRADMILFDVTGHGWWVPFRDVFEVDGQAVRERDDRLAQLFQAWSTPDALAQARAISEESARFNLSGFGIAIARTINTPMTAFAFLTAADQPRSTFSLGGIESVRGVRCRVIAFTEHAVPSLVESTDGTVQAGGRFWIDEASGRVHRSEFTAVTVLARDRARSVRAVIITTFASDARLGVWMPVRMDEHYDVSRGGTRGVINGRATYSNLRRFTVTTS